MARLAFLRPQAHFHWHHLSNIEEAVDLRPQKRERMAPFFISVSYWRRWLFYRDRLGQVARLIHVGATQYRHVIAKQL